MTIGRRAFLARAMLAAFVAPALPVHAVAGKPPHHPLRHRATPKKPLPLVMLDPGHGGKDPGAIGVSGTYEKRIALATAQLLKRRLEATGRYRVKLTRARDVFIPLAGRVALAERHGASLFVSMHADALTEHDIRGASVYTFALTASDPEAAALAERENSADRFAAPHYRNIRPEVRQILSGLIVQETRVGSATLQHAVVKSLRPHIAMLRNPAREAHFAVLRSVTIPSVLVEMGFMSNRPDERLLRQPRHRLVITSAMAGAVETYFERAQNSQLFSG